MASQEEPNIPKVKPPVAQAAPVPPEQPASPPPAPAATTPPPPAPAPAVVQAPTSVVPPPTPAMTTPAGQVAAPEAPKPKVKVISRKAPTTPKGPQKYSQYRYLYRILKGSILPILYGVISFQMLNRYVLDFPDYYEINYTLIIVGFLLGFGCTSGLIITNMIRAKKHPGVGIKLNSTIAIGICIPFLIILIVLAFNESLALAWQFSMGFFLAMIFPWIIVLGYEFSSKRKFFVQEVPDDPSAGRRLVAVQ